MTHSPRNPSATRKRRVPRADREKQMLEVAAREFGQRGYEATSMDDIAHACGVTKPMLYTRAACSW